MHEVMVDSITFHFSRSSAEDSFPVVSKLLIRPAPNISLTMMNCTDVTSSDTASIIVNDITDEDQFHDQVLNITSDSESDGVTVTLHWNQENTVTLISYNVIIIPQLGVIFIDI